MKTESRKPAAAPAPDRRRLPPLIAIVGCDGSGKSTVSAAVLAKVRAFGPAAAVHLGKQSGNVGRALSRLPLLGKPLDRKIVKESASTHGTRGERNPSLLAALVIAGFVVRRVRRFRQMLRLREAGTIIVSDRFPQLDVPHAYDGVGMSAGAPGLAPVRWLARWERARFEWMTGVRPDLVIRLNVDLDTACARKPDHRREALARKVAATPLFRFNGARIVDIDSRRPLPEVVALAEAAATQVLVECGYAAPADD